jgi:glycosyltransferase involved in cell wall biosynthesis
VELGAVRETSTPKVVHFMRARTPLAYSAESIASTIRESLQDFRFSVHHNWFARPQILGMLVDLARAMMIRGDVLHVTGDCGYIALALRGRRTVLTILDCATYWRTRGLRRWLYGQLWIKLPASRAREIIVISETVRRDVLVITGLPAARVNVVHCCISSAFFECGSSRPLRPAACPVLLQVGTTANKNIERVAESLGGLPCKLVVIGRLMPSQEQALRRHGIDYVARAGLSLHEMVDAYRRCDAVVFASTFEGFGLPIIEAQASGRPVVASDIEVHREIADQSACFVDPFDVGSIRAGVERVLRDTRYREHLIELGRRNASRFTAQRMALGYAAAYRRVIEAPNVVVGR